MQEMDTTPATTLEAARTWLRSRWNDGAPCPCCTRLVKVYKRKLNSGMARVLLEIYRIDKNIEDANAFIGEVSEWFHVVRVCQDRGVNAMSMEYSKLQHWGFIESKPGADDPSKKSAGFWRITDKGRLFVQNRITVPRHIHIYDQRLIGCSDETVSIVDALGDKFDYRELMNPERGGNE